MTFSAERISYGFENLWPDKSIYNEFCFAPYLDLQSEWDQLGSKCVRIQFSTKRCVDIIRSISSKMQPHGEENVPRKHHGLWRQKFKAGHLLYGSW